MAAPEDSQVQLASKLHILSSQDRLHYGFDTLQELCGIAQGIMLLLASGRVGVLWKKTLNRRKDKKRKGNEKEQDYKKGRRK